MVDDPELTRIRQALSGADTSEQRAIAAVGIKWIATMLRKNADYGSAIFTPPTLAQDMPCDAAIRVRMSDKIQRLSHLFATGCKTEVDESIADTVQDLGAYCLLWLVSRELQAK